MAKTDKAERRSARERLLAIRDEINLLLKDKEAHKEAIVQLRDEEISLHLEAIDEESLKKRHSSIRKVVYKEDSEC